MSADKWIWKKGQVGIERRGYLSDGNGRVDLSECESVTVTARRTTTSDPVIDDVAVVPDANQDEENTSDGKGWFTFTTDSTTGNIPVNAAGYLLEFKCVRDGVASYFPTQTDGTRTYGRLIIQRPLQD